ncbi:MAG: hypothetical protein ACYCZY_11305 [Lacisediminihabitans sp.]
MNTQDRRVVLDASALVDYLLRGPGWQTLEKLLSYSVVAAPNLTEALAAIAAKKLSGEPPINWPRPSATWASLTKDAIARMPIAGADQLWGHWTYASDFCLIGEPAWLSGPKPPNTYSARSNAKKLLTRGISC